MLQRFFNSRWSLHNPLKVWTLHSLSEREARLLISTLSVAEHRMLWVWKSGWGAWRPLSHESADILRVSEPELNGDGVPELPALLQTDEITAVKAITQVRRTQVRGYERVSVAVRAEVVLGNQTFHTRTENVSEGGIKFAQNLPDWVAGYFTVIVYEQTPMEITCMLVEDQKTDKTRVEVVETEDEESHLPRFRAWVRTTLLKKGALTE